MKDRELIEKYLPYFLLSLLIFFIAITSFDIVQSSKLPKPAHPRGVVELGFGPPF